MLLPERDLPAKLLATINALSRQRELLNNELLSHCIENYGCYDFARAKDFLRSYACTVFELIKEDCKKQTSGSYEKEAQIAEEAIQIILMCWDRVCHTYPSAGWKETVRDAIVQRVGRPLGGTPKPPVSMQESAYSASGVDAASASPLLAMAMKASREAHLRPPRLSSQITSPSAVRKMEAFMESNALNQTEFAIRANTSDKTIRKFRQTGRVKRSILTGIASAMGITKEELLRP